MSDIRPVIPRWKFSSTYYRRSLDVLNEALSKVPAYEPWRYMDPGDNCSIDARYACMPELTKKDMRENFPNGLLPRNKNLEKGLDRGDVTLVETSGTTDDKVTNIWNQKWWDASEQASWKLNSIMAKIATGEHREAILVNPKNVGIISDTVELPMEKRRLSRFLYLNEKTDTVSWPDAHMDRMVRELNEFQPAVLEANPSYLAKLSRYIAAHDKAVFQPGAIVFTYEYPTNFHYRQIRQVFFAPLVSSFGTTETGYIFMQCEKGKFHQNSAYCRVDFEPFRPEHGGPLVGRILVTPFNNPWNYLVRFDTGDLVTLEKSGHCSCGRKSGIILSSINGRKTNVTLTIEGRLVTLFELDMALSKLDGIDEFQLLQLDASTYELHLASQREDKKRLTDEATQILKTLYGQKSKVAVVYEKAISPETSGKYQVVKCLFPIDLERYLC